MTARADNEAPRRPKAYTSSFATSLIYSRSPWVTLWWSAMFPGFGHIMLCSYIKGFILIIWEFAINVKVQLNLAIVYSFTGHFDQAKAVLDTRWLLLYIPVYLYGLWDAYRVAVDVNKYVFLADIQKPPLEPFKISLLDVHFLNKRSPWGALIWSSFMPGLGHLYSHQLPTGFFILIAYVGSVYKANFLPAVHASLLGEFTRATAIVDPQWLLFLPSIYGFALYNSYVVTVEYNKLFEKEQAMYLKREYQGAKYEMPI